jgi:hypothetical protein
MTNDFGLDPEINEYLKWKRMQDNTPHVLQEKAELELRIMVERYINIFERMITASDFMLLTVEQRKNKAISMINEKFNKMIEREPDERGKQLYEKIRTDVIEGINEMRIRDLLNGD